VYAQGAVNLNPLADEWEGFKETRTFNRGGKDIVLEQEFTSKRKNGLAVYEGNVVLTDYMQSLPKELWKDKNVLELGCGTGLGSITASLLGAKLVTASDRDPVVLSLAERNMLRNLKDETSFRTARISWGTPFCTTEAQYMRDMGQCWDSKFAFQKGYDVIIGADLTYSAGLIPLLADTLNDFSGPQTEILLCWCEPKLFTWNTDVMEELNKEIEYFRSRFKVETIRSGPAFQGHDNTFLLRMKKKT